MPRPVGVWGFVALVVQLACAFAADRQDAQQVINLYSRYKRLLVCEESLRRVIAVKYSSATAEAAGGQT
jgi:hypothetical protein